MKKTIQTDAIVGAGFAGLSLAYKLAKKGRRVDLYHKDPIGIGASGVASGLLHPFPAQAASLSYRGLEGLHHSLVLLNEMQSFSSDPLYLASGILKLATEDEQKKSYAQISLKYESLEFCPREKVKRIASEYLSDPGLYIKNGCTVFCKEYLLALKKGCDSLGVNFIQKKIESKEELSGYDNTIFCVGAGISILDDKAKVKLVKGQILTIRTQIPITKMSLVSKGYITLTNNPLIYHVGSSYEHKFLDDQPDLELASELILPPFFKILPEIEQGEILRVDAGVRVMNPKNYIPFIKKYSFDTFAIIGLGSRGLLYHAMLAEILSEELIHKRDDQNRDFFY